MSTSESAGNDGLAPRQTLAREAVSALCVALCLTMSGCRHKQTPPLLPAIVVAPPVQPPAPAAPAMKAPPPATLSEMPMVKVTEAKPKPRPRKKTTGPVLAQTSSPPPSGAQAPGNADGSVPITSSTALSTLGELSAGGETNPRNQQEVTELVAASEHRLETLLKTKVGQQQEQTREVRHFLEQARQALTTGDAEGARTLTTKAMLLMDDLEKWAAQ